ncbi:hypothetical protein EES39_28175 [Streptomyces sp. ADI92-24]|uniref:hypothetical protein n=1 Tax=Streptomyces sp. ADI92-24 TaxID=1522756 RepID=UPI000FA55110|nr:hypothetical protein EES39_28175 [Streptomyces sp. ADI92-24]
MANKTLARGMGTFFKDCEHSSTRWSKCPHEYTIRYRNAAGKQTEESGFATQDKAIERLTEVYTAKKAAPRSQKAEFEQYGGGYLDLERRRRPGHNVSRRCTVRQALRDASRAGGSAEGPYRSFGELQVCRGGRLTFG